MVEKNKGLFRYAGLSDLWNLFRATTISTLIILFAIFIFSKFEGFSRSILIIDWALTILLTGGLRFFIRYFFQLLGSVSYWGQAWLIGVFGG